MHKQHKEEGGTLGIKNINMRLAPEDISNRLTGFEHNAVTPIGSASPDMPIVLSHRRVLIAAANIIPPACLQDAPCLLAGNACKNNNNWKDLQKLLNFKNMKHTVFRS